MKILKKVLALVLTLALVCFCGMAAFAATTGRDVSQSFKVTDPDGKVTSGTIFFQRGESFTIGYTWGKDPLNSYKECWVLTINGVPVSTRGGRYTFCRSNGVDAANAATANLSAATILYEGSWSAGVGPSVIYASKDCLPNRTLSYSGYSGNLWNGIQFSKAVTPPATNYAVTYDANAGSDTVANMPASGSFAAGSTVTIPTAIPTRTGYTFQNWLDTASNTIYTPGTSFAMPERAVALRAQWKNNTPDTGWQRDKNLSFNVTDPNGEKLTGIVFFNSKESFTIGYTWGTDPLNTSKECWVLTINGVKVSQNSKGQYAFYRINGMDLPNTSAYAGAPTEATISYEGSHVAGFGPSVIYAPQDCMPNRTLSYSNYTSTLSQGIQFPAAKKSYDVTFATDAEDDVTGMPANASCVEGETFVIPAEEPVRGGYVFAGWKDAEGAAYAAGASFTMPSKAVVLTAQWTKIVSLSGKVTSEGKAVENCPVTLKNLTTNKSVSVKTDAEGAYAFADLTEGAYLIYIAQTDEYYGCYLNVTVDKEIMQNVDLESKTPVTPDNPTFTGWVYDVDGNGVANCSISLRNLTTDTPYTLHTDAEGYFAEVLPAGNYRLYIGAAKGNKAYSANFTITENATQTLEINLKK